MFHRIMVATDFSASSEAAANAGMSLALAYAAEVILVHVVSFVYYDVAYANIRGAEDEARRSAEKRLAEIAATMEARHLKVRTLVRAGKAGESIADAAHEEGADLVVVGTHGRHGLNRLLLGSVAERVVRLAPCHVLTVKSA